MAILNTRSSAGVLVKAIFLVLMLGFPCLLEAQTVQVVHDFVSTGIFPHARVIEGSDGYLYGTTTIGGGAQQGTIFKVSKDGTNFTQLKGLGCRLNLDGCMPYGSLIASSDGYLYGTTTEGSYFGGGTLFRIAMDGSNFTLLWIFSCSDLDSCKPTGELLDGGDGYLYGTTAGPGFGMDGGSIFKLAKNATEFAVLRKFSCGQPADGCQAFAGLVEGGDGFLYGTTYRGGSFDQGTIFKIAKDGTGFTLLKSLDCAADDACAPYGELTQGTDGFLYGSTSRSGMLFKVAKDGAGFTVLRQSPCHGPDGCDSRGRLIEGTDGMLYGTTIQGGMYSQGTLFRIGKEGQNFATLKSFDCNPDGCNPHAGLTQGSDGFLYGTTVQGGLSGHGTVFKIATDGTSFTVITPMSCVPWSGCLPFAETVEGSDGFLYGTTFYGGAYNQGTVYKVGREGEGFTSLKSFKCDDTEGCNPSTKLLEASDGLLYGTTSDSSFGAGTLFRIAKNGTGFVRLRKFQCGSNDGCSPGGGLTEGNDGLLYGTTGRGGAYDHGTLFKMAKDGTGFALLQTFQCAVPTNGCFPANGVIEGSDGFLYGTTAGGGDAHGGTIFRIAKDGTAFTVLKSIQCVMGDGCQPRAILIEASDGFLYGTTGEWQFSSSGSLFKIARDGTGYQQLKLFPCNNLGGPCPPLHGVVEGKDGFLYGATRWYSDTTPTVIFKIAKDGTGYSEIHHFACDGDNGCHPEAGLAKASDGFLYGTTTAGGFYGGGALYRILIGDAAPNRIVDLKAIASAQGSVTLQWTAPGDNANTGTAENYDVRVSITPLDASNWVSAAQVTGEPLPLQAGSVESFTVTGLLCGRTYYLSIKAIDTVNVSSELSNVVRAKTRSCNRLTVSSSLPAGEVNVPYNSGLLSISGGVAPYVVQIVPDTLPQGLALNSFAIVGTPKEAKSATISAVISDAVGSVSKAKFKIKIVKPVSIATTSLKAGKINSNYSFVLKVKDGMKPHTWAIEGSSSLPGGGTLSLDPERGRITAFPTAPGSVDINFRVSDVLGGTELRTFRLIFN